MAETSPTASEAPSSGEHAPPRPEGRGRFALVVLALLIVTAIAYAPVLWAGLLGWDDRQTLADNPLMNPPTADGVAWYWRHSHMHLWVPLTYTIWSGVAAFAHEPGGEMAAWPFHALNLGFHLGTVAVVAGLLRRLGLCRVPTLLGATLFALHPINVEAVAWASGLKDVLATLLMFAAALAWVGPNAQPASKAGPAPVRWMALATLLYALALLTKPTAIVTPALAWLLAIAVGQPWRTAAGRLVPWAILAVPIAIIGAMVQPPSSGEVVAIHLRPLVALDAIGFYLAKLAWPLDLTVDYGRTPTRLLGGALSLRHVPIAAGLLTIAALATWKLAPAARRLVAIGAAIALLTLGPVLGFVPFDFQAISSVADHYCYPAMVGVAVVVAAIASRWRTRTIRIATLAIAMLLGPLAFRQARTWHDDAALFGRVLAVNPQSWSARSAFSYAAFNAGDLAAAERWARDAIDHNDRYPVAWVNLASAQSRRGDDDAAIASLERALAIEPTNATVNLNLGGLLAQRGEMARAFPLLQAAAEFDPTNAAAQGNFGTALLQLGRDREALAHLALAARFAPADPSLRTKYALALAVNGNVVAARREVDAVLAIDPTFADALTLRRELQAAPR